MRSTVPATLRISLKIGAVESNVFRQRQQAAGAAASTSRCGRYPTRLIKAMIVFDTSRLLKAVRGTRKVVAEPKRLR